MCEFCDRNFERRIPIEDEDGTNIGFLNGIYLYIENSLRMNRIPINNCPKCGRKLIGESRMFEVVYISPSREKAMDFIVDLADKIEEIGIDIRNIDYDKVQLMTDKYIVSTANICSSYLYVSHKEVKYCIDMVSGEKFQTPEQHEHAMERIKFLKRCFRETREISEEELIEILREG